ncbi:MAG: oligosaccharide flippase family protein [Candidatus Sulfotelmatobacter sp.]|jgi:O-antigen/teichoic acid export membrane protein
MVRPNRIHQLSGFGSAEKATLTLAATGQTNIAVPAELKTPAEEVPLAPVHAGALKLGAGQVVRRVFRFFFLLFVARLLGPEVLGIYTLLLAVVELLAILSGTGFMDYATREVARNPEVGRTLWRRLGLLRVAYLVILAPAAIALMLLMKYPEAVLFSLSLMAISLFPRSFLEIGLGVLRGANCFAVFFWAELMQGLVLFGVAFGLVLQGNKLFAVVVAELVSSLSGAFVVCLFGLRHVWKNKKPLPSSFRLLRETYVFNVIPLIVNTYDRLDIVLLSKLAGNVAVGIYSLPYRVFAALQAVPYGVMGVLLPRLSISQWGLEEKVRCNRVTSVLFGCALFLILPTMLLSDTLTPRILGARYEGASAALKILIWATLPMYLNYGFNTFLLARNRERVFIRTALVCLAFNFAANLILIPRYSFRAAAATTILTELVLLGQNLLLVRKVLGFIPRPGDPYMTIAVFSAILCAGLFGMRFAPVLPISFVALLLFTVYLYFYCNRNVLQISSRRIAI